MNPNISTDLKTAFGADALSFAAVEGGWLNRKWRAETTRGSLLVKQYSRERFTPRQLDQIESALQKQIILHQSGVPCPEVFACEGRVIRHLSDGTAYMAMRFLPGKAVDHKGISQEQLQSIGRALGQIQLALTGLTGVGERGWPLTGSSILLNLRENYARRMSESGCEAYRRAVAAQKPILDAMTEHDLDALPRGLSHEDFTPDNMLLDGNRTVILDFDRTQYGFLWHDVGRILLSLCLREDRLDKTRARAILDGYAQFMPAPDPADALRTVWRVETPWWILPSAFENPSPKVARFRDELLWLTQHYMELDSLTDGL